MTPYVHNIDKNKTKAQNHSCGCAEQLCCSVRALPRCLTGKLHNDEVKIFVMPDSRAGKAGTCWTAQAKRPLFRGSALACKRRRVTIATETAMHHERAECLGDLVMHTRSRLKGRQLSQF